MVQKVCLASGVIASWSLYLFGAPGRRSWVVQLSRPGFYSTFFIFQFAASNISRDIVRNTCRGVLDCQQEVTDVQKCVKIRGVDGRNALRFLLVGDVSQNPPRENPGAAGGIPLPVEIAL
jgi:hypothetical protein